MPNPKRDEKNIEFFVLATRINAMPSRFSTKSVLLWKAGASRSSISCNGQSDLWGDPSNFPVDGGKLVGQVAYYHFSIRHTRGWCVPACV